MGRFTALVIFLFSHVLPISYPRFPAPRDLSFPVAPVIFGDSRQTAIGSLQRSAQQSAFLFLQGADR